MDSSEFRAQVAPLNQPSADMSPQIRAAARSASTDAFHLAVMVSAGLLLVGAAINAVGIRNPSAAGRRGGPGGEVPPPDAAGAGGPVRGSSDDFVDVSASERTPTGPAREA